MCPICNSSNYKIIGEPKTNHISAAFINKNYKVVQCNKCNLYFIFPMIDFDEKQWAMLYNSEYFSIQSKWLIRRRNKELNSRFNKVESYLSKRDIKFLDIGPGEGKALIEGAKRGWDVTGIDFVDNRIEGAKINDVKFIKSKFLEKEFIENYYDFIYLDSVLEHVLDPLSYLRKIRKILRPGGIIYIGVPNEDSLFNEIRRLIFNLTGKKEISVKLKPFDSPFHVIGFNQDSLNYLIRKTNLEIKLFRNFGRKFDFLSNYPNQKGFWIDLFFLFPVEIIGSILKKDVYFEFYLSKNRANN